MDRGIQRAGIGPEKSLTSGYALKATEIHVPSITGSQDASLIPGLPDDVAKFCLALVPRLDFPAMSCVSRSWKALLRSKEFHLVRMKAGTLEEWLYALTVIPGLQEMRWQVLNPDCRWKCLPPMPGPMKVGFGLVVVDGKLLVIGGLVEEDSKCVARADVLEYDSATNRWSKLANMNTARYGFACAVVGDYVYVVGGHGDGKNLSSVEVYDPQKNMWAHVPSLKRTRWGCIACGLEGKLFVMGGRSSLTIGNSQFIDVYDPSTGEWQEMKNGCVMVLAHAVLDRKLFCIEWKNERKLAVYDAAENTWRKVSLPVTGSLSVGFCLGKLNGKLLLFPSKTEQLCKTLVYDPNATRGSEWQTSAIRPCGTCICCATITA
eukprot:c27847_g1_i1 orf=1265-2392(+)